MWFPESGEGKEKADRLESGQSSARRVHVSGHLACAREDSVPNSLNLSKLSSGTG